MKIGKWKLEIGSWKLENGNRKRGSWKTKNGKWKLENGIRKREVAWHLSATVDNYYCCACSKTSISINKYVQKAGEPENNAGFLRHNS